MMLCGAGRVVAVVSAVSCLASLGCLATFLSLIPSPAAWQHTAAAAQQWMQDNNWDAAVQCSVCYCSVQQWCSVLSRCWSRCPTASSGWWTTAGWSPAWSAWPAYCTAWPPCCSCQLPCLTPTPLSSSPGSPHTPSSSSSSPPSSPSPPSSHSS